MNAKAEIHVSEPPISPGEALRRAMAERGWSQPDLAYVLGVNAAAVNQILNGKRGISADMAKALARAFNVPDETFAKVQAAWDVFHAQEADPSVSARAEVQTHFPLREMIKRGWVRETGKDDLEEQLCKFFNVNNLSEIPNLAHAAKRTVSADIPASQLAWLFRVRQIALEMPTPTYSADRLKSALEQMKLMLQAPEETRHVPRLLHESGVRFIVVEALPGSKIDGVCFWLDKSSPVIGMSLRFDRIDNFWFVLRHECAHVLHGHGLNQEAVAIIDCELESQPEQVSEDERVANFDASNFMIPQEKMQSFYLRKKPFFAERDVLAFASILKVHPGLVIGQLHKILGRYDLLRKHLVSVRSHVSSSALVDGWGDIIPVG